MNDHGADAVRWFMLASGSPWQARRVGHAAIGDVVRKTLLTYWNTVAFQSLYGRLADWDPGTAGPDPADRPVIDRWLLSEAHRLAIEVDSALDQFDTQRAGRLLAAYIDDLSNWYVRRSRRRFWDGDPAALATLHEALRITTLCMAPFTPFITERVWQDLFSAGDAADSVHLQAWPAVVPALVDDKLSRDMALVRRVVELGRAARASSGVRTRQPLRRALVSAPGWSGLSAELIEQVCEELNIGSTDALDSDEAGFVDISMKANFRALGQRFGKQTPLVAKAIADADAALILAAIRQEGVWNADVRDLGSVEIGADDVIVTETPREGWAVATEAGESIALDLVITDELRRAGLAREVVRAIQEARKNAGFEISDRISIWWTSTDEEARLMWAAHGDEIAAEVLATSVTQSSGGTFAVQVPELQLDLAITRN